MSIQIKRVYEIPKASDGYRILTDRLWPRGVSKEKAKLDIWAKEIAPSPELRKWFGHDPERYEEFKEKYAAELKENKEMPAFIDLVRTHSRKGTVTLLYGAKDREHNQAVVLKEFLEDWRE